MYLFVLCLSAVFLLGCGSKKKNKSNKSLTTRKIKSNNTNTETTTTVGITNQRRCFTSSKQLSKTPPVSKAIRDTVSETKSVKPTGSAINISGQKSPKGNLPMASVVKPPNTIPQENVFIDLGPVTSAENFVRESLREQAQMSSKMDASSKVTNKSTKDIPTYDDNQSKTSNASNKKKQVAKPTELNKTKSNSNAMNKSSSVGPVTSAENFVRELLREQAQMSSKMDASSKVTNKSTKDIPTYDDNQSKISNASSKKEQVAKPTELSKTKSNSNAMNKSSSKEKSEEKEDTLRSIESIEEGECSSGKESSRKSKSALRSQSITIFPESYNKKKIK
uniref:Uncharacterized protein n=1 Tax=Rhabditophanes sp. KR3021 TaxID=114890 RepID=A0AC35TRL2_9BILA